MEEKQEVYEIDDFLKKYVNSNLEKVRKYGLVLLEPMEKSERRAISNYLDEISDISSFSIGSSGLDKKQVVLRHRPHIDEIINFSEVRRVADNAYKRGSYDYCIKLYRKILAFSRIKEVTFAKIGLAYMCKDNANQAIQYLTVAMEVAKKNNKYVKNGNYDFSRIISKLRKKPDTENSKPYFEMNEEDFYGEEDTSAEVTASREIYKLICNGEMTFEDACCTFHLSEDNKNQISLFYAKDCYTLEQYTLGDVYLKKVEKAKDKSKATKELFEEVRKNRSFYKNRKSSFNKQLIKM